MKYRNFTSIDWKPSALGFGAMRFPIIDNDQSKIDEEKAIKMIRYAIDHGVNYVDTAWPYHKEQSEILVGKALKDGYRKKVKIATKLPSWLINKKEDMDYYLNKQLEKLQTEHIDFYLLHTLNREYWENYKKLDVFKWLEKVQKAGKIKYIGFSFHDKYDLFTEIVDYYDKWDFCQIQYNYLDTEFQAGKKGLKYAADRNLGVIIMEPLRGGLLAGEQPVDIQKIWQKSKIKRTAADWALQWLWNQEEVSLVLSGMSTLKQVKENVESTNSSAINSLTKKELGLIKEVQKEYEKLSPITCTGCSYCVPCPNNVDIPENFDLYNHAHIYNSYEKQSKKYQAMDEKNRANQCIQCGECLDKCPQNLEIIELLAKVKDYFE